MEDQSIRNNEPDARTDNVPKTEDPMFLEEIVIEELAVDGICGVY